MKKLLSLLLSFLLISSNSFPESGLSKYCKNKEIKLDHAKCAGEITVIIVAPIVAAITVGLLVKYGIFKKIAVKIINKILGLKEGEFKGTLSVDDFGSLLDAYHEILKNPEAIKDILKSYTFPKSYKDPITGKKYLATDLWDLITAKYQVAVTSSDFELLEATVKSLKQALDKSGLDIANIDSFTIEQRVELLNRLLDEKSDFYKFIEKTFSESSGFKVDQTVLKESVNKIVKDLIDVTFEELSKQYVTEKLPEVVYNKYENEFKQKNITEKDIRDYLEKNPSDYSKIQSHIESSIEKTPEDLAGELKKAFQEFQESFDDSRLKNLKQKLISEADQKAQRTQAYEEEIEKDIDEQLLNENIKKIERELTELMSEGDVQVIQTNGPKMYEFTSGPEEGQKFEETRAPSGEEEFEPVTEPVAESFVKPV